MDDHTDRLRDLFLEVTGADTVTDSQEEGPGTLTTDTSVHDRLATVIETMRERLDFKTELELEIYIAIVEAFYEGDSDEAIAATTDVTPSIVRRARYDLHLVRSTDWSLDVDPEDVRPVLEGSESIDDAADRLDVDASVLRQARPVVSVSDEIRRTNRRFVDQFEELLADGDVRSRYVAEAHRHGLADATDDMENLPPL